MLASRFIKQGLSKGAVGKRFLATVTGSTGRQMPAVPARSTPVTYDRATFTIRVCFVSLTFRGWNDMLMVFRMGQPTMEALSVEVETSLEKLCSPLHWLVTQNL